MALLWTDGAPTPQAGFSFLRWHMHPSTPGFGRQSVRGLACERSQEGRHLPKGTDGADALLFVGPSSRGKGEVCAHRVDTSQAIVYTMSVAALGTGLVPAP